MSSQPAATSRPAREHIAEFEAMYAGGREPFDYTRRAVEALRHDLVATTALGLGATRALDLGCGLGQIATRIVAIPTVFAMDLSITAVARAAAAGRGGDSAASEPVRAAARSGAEARAAAPVYLSGSALALPLRDRSLDLVIASDGLVSWHLSEEQRAQALREIRRVLRPGGSALLTEYIRGHQFDGFVSAVAASGLRPDQVRAITDRPWYWFESWIKAFHGTRAGSALRRSRRLARALLAAGRPLGRRGARHILVIARRPES